MGRQSISKEVERGLYAESMGKCMNLECENDIVNIGEKAQ